MAIADETEITDEEHEQLVLLAAGDLLWRGWAIETIAVVFDEDVEYFERHLKDEVARLSRGAMN